MLRTYSVVAVAVCVVNTAPIVLKIFFILHLYKILTRYNKMIQITIINQDDKFEEFKEK